MRSNLVDKDRIFSFANSISDKVLEAPNNKVKEFAEEHFGSYKNYLEEIRRLIREDSMNLLKAFGDEPLFYCQVKEDDPVLRGIQSSYQQGVYCDFPLKNQLYLDFLSKNENQKPCIASIENFIKKYSFEINIPSHLIWCMERAHFYLSEREFSMFINWRGGSLLAPIEWSLNKMPVNIFPIGKNREITKVGVTAKYYGQPLELIEFKESGAVITPPLACENPYHQWGRLFEDPKLYRSLTSIVEAVKQERDMPAIKIEWSTGYCRFIRTKNKSQPDAQDILQLV
ncbi:hypothetical protein HYU07_03685 [Candidatus Woesearchaeota archaeon]|nr:hypothetical protein [Candidatus Woesearchaeota archaeon]